jgi:hypothetical protein
LRQHESLDVLVAKKALEARLRLDEFRARIGDGQQVFEPGRQPETRRFGRIADGKRARAQFLQMAADLFHAGETERRPAHCPRIVPVARQVEVESARAGRPARTRECIRRLEQRECGNAGEYAVRATPRTRDSVAFAASNRPGSRAARK